jgi:hypothetical protein
VRFYGCAGKRGGLMRDPDLLYHSSRAVEYHQHDSGRRRYRYRHMGLVYGRKQFELSKRQDEEARD